MQTNLMKGSEGGYSDTKLKHEHKLINKHWVCLRLQDYWKWEAREAILQQQIDVLTYNLVSSKGQWGFS